MSTEFTARTAPEGPAARPAPVPEIEGSTLFAGCPDVVGTPFSYAREEEIYGEGEEAEFVYKVLSGAVRTHRVLSDGRRQITGFHLPGDLFGLGQGETNRQTAEALTSTKVLIFKRRQVERAATGRAEVACRLWSMATSDTPRTWRSCSDGARPRSGSPPSCWRSMTASAPPAPSRCR